MARAKRMRVNVVGAARKRGQVDRFSGTKKPVEFGQIIAIASDIRGTVMRLANLDDDLVISETLERLLADSAGALISLTPVGFEDDHPGEKHAARGAKIAVNPDFITFKAGPKRGAVVQVEGAPRAIVVRETPAKIEALIDA